MRPISRDTARVLPVADDGSCLLLRERDPSRPGTSWWGSIGGGVDLGESVLAAAVRELREETGIEVEPAALVPAYEYSYRSTYDGVAHAGVHTFFVMSLDRETPVSFDQLVPAEIGNVLASGWWTPAALDDDGGALAPELLDAMRAAVRVLGEGS